MQVIKGRGAVCTPPPRFVPLVQESCDDGWAQDAVPTSIATEVRPEIARSLINHNDSPDLPFNYSINPYRGCEHGCTYCYARPAHAYVDLSPGLDFETRLFYKRDAPGLLRRQLATGRYAGQTIALGANTDAYQPLDRQLQISRKLLKVMRDFHQPVVIVTKSALVLRDVDILADMAEQGLCQVYLSVTTLDDGLKRIMEPRAAAPSARPRTVTSLRRSGVPIGVMVAPVIPFINDQEMEAILGAAAAAGAQSARYIVLRLPNEVAPMFRSWLRAHFPERAERVVNAIRALRGGRDNDPRFGSRLRGEGVFAELLARRFAVAARREGLDSPLPALVPSVQAAPVPTQIALF